MTMRAKSAGVSSRPSRRMVRSSSVPLSRPTGAARFCVCSACTTSPTPMPAACRACGLSAMVISRSMPPTTRTSATPVTPRNCRVRPGSAIRVRSPPVSVLDASVSCTIGKSFGSNLVRIGSSISGGRSLRICEMPSRMSCVASCRSLAKMNSTVITPKLSSALLWIFLTPLIAEICSSIGSMTSRSTVSGEAPGYGTATDTMGGETSGNSSVFSWTSAKMPNTTSASMLTTVMIGRRIEKSEMNTSVPCAGRRGRPHLHRACPASCPARPQPAARRLRPRPRRSPRVRSACRAVRASPRLSRSCRRARAAPTARRCAR